MNHKRAEEMFTAAIEARLGDAQARGFEEHLRSCSRCRQAFEDCQRIYSIERIIGSASYAPPEGLSDRVMKRIEEEQAQPGFFPSAVDGLLMRLRILFAVAAAAVAVLLLVIHPGSRSGGGPDFGGSGAGAGGPLGSYSEANFDDELIPNAVGSLFNIIEGTVGALAIVLCGSACIGCALAASIKKSRRLACAAMLFLIIAVFIIAVRQAIQVYFGTECAAAPECIE